MSIRVLAFNTTTELCSVALMVDQHMYIYNVVAPRCHSEKILYMIDRLLSEVGVTLQSLDYLIFDKGPGSFAGIRIGISIAQGLALGADLPLIEVSSLVVLAQGAWRVFKASRVITTIDAHAGRLYWADYCRTTDHRWTVYHNSAMLISEKFIQKLICSLSGNWVLVGTGWNNYSNLMYVHSKESIILKRSIMFPDAQDMFSLGMYKWKNKVFVVPNKIQPIYLCEKLFVKKYLFNI